MKKIVTALLGCGDHRLGDDGDFGHGRGPLVGPGSDIGGVVAGAVVGSALAAPYYYPYGYYTVRIPMDRAFGAPTGTDTAGYAPATKRERSRASQVNDGVPVSGRRRLLILDNRQRPDGNRARMHPISAKESIL